MNVTVNLMTNEDIDAVVNISNISFSHPWSRASYEQELQNPLARYFVAKVDEKIIGFIGTWLVVDESHITNVAVDPKYRKCGIGSILIENLLKYCEKNGCISSTLEVRESNTPARLLYEKYGFKENGIRKGYYQDNKENAILMWLNHDDKKS